MLENWDRADISSTNSHQMGLPTLKPIILYIEYKFENRFEQYSFCLFGVAVSILLLHPSSYLLWTKIQFHLPSPSSPPPRLLPSCHWKKVATCFEAISVRDGQKLPWIIFHPLKTYISMFDLFSASCLGLKKKGAFCLATNASRNFLNFYSVMFCRDFHLWHQLKRIDCSVCPKRWDRT